MKAIPRWRRPLAVLVLAIAGTIPSRSDAATAAGEPYASAQDCARCHRTIHTYWSESEHARSATNPTYLAALASAIEKAADKDLARRNCVWCHAPTALVTGDYAMQKAVTKEGVSCDFCHTVAGVDLNRSEHPFDLAPGSVKRGPLEYGKSMSAHGTEYSTLHKASPLLCAACHEYRNPAGVAVLSTYSEWTAGPYPLRGQTCQECHMPAVPGTDVSGGLDPARRQINLHRLVGGSVASRIRGGLDLRFGSVAVGAASADVQVVVANTGVGHSAPGGLSSKSLVLAVGVDTGTGELAHRREKVYRRELRDAEGHALTTVSELFVRAASVGPDTRLKQKESRTEQFTVPLPDNWKAIVARLEYHDDSDPRAPKTTLVAEQRRERGRSDVPQEKKP
jgi:hypothetical protein